MFTPRDYAMMLEPLVKHWLTPVLKELVMNFAPWLNFTVEPYVMRILTSAHEVYIYAFILYMVYSIVSFFMVTMVKPAVYVVSTIINLPCHLLSFASYLLSLSNQHQKTVTVHVTPYYDYKLDRKYTFELPGHNRLTLSDVLGKVDTFDKRATVCSVLVHRNDVVKDVNYSKYNPEQDDNIIVFLTKKDYKA